MDFTIGKKIDPILERYHKKEIDLLEVRKVIEKMKGERSASGAVDTVAEAEDREIIVNAKPTAEYKIHISKIEKITREAPSEGHL